jgi:hypothetical protein
MPVWIALEGTRTLSCPAFAFLTCRSRPPSFFFFLPAAAEHLHLVGQIDQACSPWLQLLVHAAQLVLACPLSRLSCLWSSEPSSAPVEAAAMPPWPPHAPPWLTSSELPLSKRLHRSLPQLTPHFLRTSSDHLPHWSTTCRRDRHCKAAGARGRPFSN